MIAEKPMPESAEEKSRKKSLFSVISNTEIPLAVYAAIFITMAGLWVFQELHEDVTLGLFTELLGAAFTLFIIDTLLVRSKAKRWKLVQQHIDYLIARNVNRLRDGIAVRFLGFEPDIPDGLTEDKQLAAIRQQRAELLLKMADVEPEQLVSHLSESSLFTENTYLYLNERADDIWDVINMKYAEYMAPELVSSLIRLHTHIKDVCGHLRQFQRAERFPEDAVYYHQIARMGAGFSVAEIIKLVNELKAMGYSESAVISGHIAADLDRVK